MLYTEWTKINKAFNEIYVLTATYRANKSNTANSGYGWCSYSILRKPAEHSIANKFILIEWKINLFVIISLNMAVWKASVIIYSVLETCLNQLQYIAVYTCTLTPIRVFDIFEHTHYINLDTRDSFTYVIFGRY
jgi:hypothetical protein